MTEVAARASDYGLGDVVMRYDGIHPGVVIGVHPGINQVDAEFATGWERIDPEELIPLSKYSLLMNRGKASPSFLFTNTLFKGNYDSDDPSSARRDKRAYVTVGREKVERPTLTREERLVVLGESLFNSTGRRHAKIAGVIADNYSSSEWAEFVNYSKRIARVVVSSEIYARRTYTLQDGRRLKIVANLEKKNSN
jgi:hypothetical protein